MSAGTLIFILLIGGLLFAMLGRRRGGQSHGMGMGCGGHGHGSSDDHHDQPQRTNWQSDARQARGGGPMTGDSSEHSHGNEPAPPPRHRGCC